METHQQQAPLFTLATFHPSSLSSRQSYERPKSLAVLLPATDALPPRTLLSDAVNFVESYSGEVPQLEYMLDTLYAALLQAWQQEAYEVVARLVMGLAPLIPRFNRGVLAEQVLRFGILASHHMHDAYRSAYLSRCLANTLFTQGRFQHARKIWQQQGQHDPRYQAWEPLISFAYTADLLEHPANIEIFITSLREDQPDTLAVAFFLRGLYARYLHRHDEACEAYTLSLKYLVLQRTDTYLAEQRRLFQLVVQTELARVTNNFPLAQRSAETTLSLAAAYSDGFTLVDLAFDQSHYAYTMGQTREAKNALRLLQHVSEQMEHEQLARFSDHRFFHILTQEETLHPLSKREIEILQLADQGCSNQEIAQTLCISLKTVKKHLENIFLKLSVHNRTSALAKSRHLFR